MFRARDQQNRPASRALHSVSEKGSGACVEVKDATGSLRRGCSRSGMVQRKD